MIQIGTKDSGATRRVRPGLAFDAAANLWEQGVGPKGGDEVNLIEPGLTMTGPTAATRMAAISPIIGALSARLPGRVPRDGTPESRGRPRMPTPPAA